MINDLSAATLSITNPGWLLGTLTALVVVAVVTVVVYSFVILRQGKKTTGTNVVRAMLAIVLVSAIVLLAGAALGGTGTEQTTNLLVGGVVASAASAVAFYFAARSAQDSSEAQQRTAEAQLDIIKAALGTETVPDLTRGTLRDAQNVLSTSSLVLALPPSTNGKLDMDTPVKNQKVAAGTSVAKGTVIAVDV